MLLASLLSQNLLNKLLLFAIFLFLVILCIHHGKFAEKYSFYFPSVLSFSTEKGDSKNASKKYIFAWTLWNGEKRNFDTEKVPWFSECPVSNCAMTSNRSNLRTVDAVIFYIPDYKKENLPHRLYRQTWQYYIFHLMESPGTTPELMQ